MGYLQVFSIPINWVTKGLIFKVIWIDLGIITKDKIKIKIISLK
jgi:hypothetical protein